MIHEKHERTQRSTKSHTYDLQSQTPIYNETYVTRFVSFVVTLQAATGACLASSATKPRENAPMSDQTRELTMWPSSTSSWSW